MRHEIQRPFKDWSLLYMGIDELIKKPPLSSSSEKPTDTLFKEFDITVMCAYSF